MKVFLLGAGASKSYSDSPAGEKMPVALDFFQTFNKLDIASNPWVLVGGLIAYLKEKGISNPESYLDSGVDIEALHSEIEAQRNIGISLPKGFISHHHAIRAYIELIFVFASTINEIQNGPPSKAHRNIARHLTSDDAIITFNWDTLIDRALTLETDWRVDWGYGHTPHSIYSNKWRPALAKNPASSAPKLIKLHGSTNWITAYPVTDKNGKTRLTHELDPSTLSVFEYADKEYACYQGRYMDRYQPFSFGYYPPNLQNIPSLAAPDGQIFAQLIPKPRWMPEGEASRDGLTSMPLIIPPVQNKTYDLFGGLFKALWSEAKDMITKADEIIIVGYSFPRTDLQSDQLFKKAFSRKTKLPNITIIDPNPVKIAEKFTCGFGIPSSHLRVITDYFSDTFDLSTL